MSLIQLGHLAEPPSYVPPIDQWSDDEKRGLYELVRLWVSLTTVAKWMAAFVMFFAALATLGYYVIGIGANLFAHHSGSVTTSKG